MSLGVRQEKCPWCLGSELYEAYHDNEWGQPVHDDRLLFEMLILEGAQAGLSWITILKRRESYREAFFNFDPMRVAQITLEEQQGLMQNAGIIRNRLKIESAVKNAKAFLQIQAAFGSFDQYLWHFVHGQQVINHYETLSQVPASTPLSDTISKDLKRRGFSFVGSTIVYAYLQAVGVVDDHLLSCYKRQQMK